MELVYKTIGQELFLEQINDIIASDSLNYLTASFNFDATWDGYLYTAVFCLDPRNININNIWAVMLDDNNKCAVPAGVLQNRGKFYVGVFGVKGDNVRITSTFVQMYKETGAAYYIPEDQLTLYEQILIKLTEVQNELAMKQKQLIAGLNITIEDNHDGTATISAADIELFIIVDELPSIGEPNRIYLVPEDGGSFEEWAWINDEWKLLGNLTIDLSNYYTKAEVDSKLLPLSKKNSGADITIAASDSYNKEEANLICTGTNDHIIIQQALDTIGNNGGGKVLLRAGTYNIGASINLNQENITLEGMGAGTLVIDMRSDPLMNTDGTIIINGGIRCQIKDIQFTSYGGNTGCSIFIASGAVYTQITGNIFESNKLGVQVGVYEPSQPTTRATIINNIFIGTDSIRIETGNNIIASNFYLYNPPENLGAYNWIDGVQTGENIPSAGSFHRFIKHADGTLINYGQVQMNFPGATTVITAPIYTSAAVSLGNYAMPFVDINYSIDYEIRNNASAHIINVAAMNGENKSPTTIFRPRIITASNLAASSNTIAIMYKAIGRWK